MPDPANSRIRTIRTETGTRGTFEGERDVAEDEGAIGRDGARPASGPKTRSSRWTDFFCDRRGVFRCSRSPDASPGAGRSRLRSNARPPSSRRRSRRRRPRRPISSSRRSVRCSSRSARRATSPEESSTRGSRSTSRRSSRSRVCGDESGGGVRSGCRAENRRPLALPRRREWLATLPPLRPTGRGRLESRPPADFA